MHAKFLAGLAGAAFLLAPFSQAADKPEKHTRESGDMARAIAFQRAKDVADARQARLEAKHPTVNYSRSADRSADPDVSGQRVPDRGEPLYQQEKEKENSADQRRQ
jgi:hypothetical protein